METSTNNVPETDLAQTILKYEKPTFPDDNSHLTLPQTPEEIKKEEEESKSKFSNHQLKINQHDFETINSLIDKDKELQTSLKLKKKFNFRKIFITDDINPDDNQSRLDVETEEKFDVKMNEIIKQKIKMWLLMHYQIRKYLILLF